MITLTHAYYIEEDKKEAKIMRPYIPLGILGIASYLRENAIEVDLYDSTFKNYDLQLNHIRLIKPSLLAIYTNLMTRHNVLKLIREVKHDSELGDVKIILGGPEVRYHAEALLNWGADMVITGEGEETLLELCNYFIQEKRLPHHLFGTVIKVNEKVVFNPERNLIKNIDSLPVPERDREMMKPYLLNWKKFHGYTSLSISTMRGCPYTCKWCSRAVYGGTYRRRSPEKVVEEMLYLKSSFNPNRLWFVDDVFTISHKWLRHFVEEVTNKNAQIPYEIITRADRLNEEILDLLKSSGCYRIWIGAESGSQRIIDLMDRRVSVAKVKDMIIKTKQKKMEAGTFIMLGYPGEERKDMLKSIAHLKNSAPDYYTITIAYPIKGTALHEEIKQSIYKEADWETGSDRDVLFKRKHTYRYYQFAMKWVVNEVEYSRKKDFKKRTIHKLKSISAQVLMLFYSFKN